MKDIRSPLLALPVGVTVLVFGPLRECCGRAELRGRGRTVAEVWASVVAQCPRAAGWTGALRAARNLAYCEWDEPVATGDTVAFLPPVSGGAARLLVAVVDGPIDVPSWWQALDDDADGAVAAFVGRVRRYSQGHRVEAIEYHAYREMAHRELHRIGEELCSHMAIGQVILVHRIGTVEVGETSLVVAVAAPHRQEALRACGLAIAAIKARLPIWKQEFRDDGVHWVEAECGSARVDVAAACPSLDKVGRAR